MIFDNIALNYFYNWSALYRWYRIIIPLPYNETEAQKIYSKAPDHPVGKLQSQNSNLVCQISKRVLLCI